MNDRDIVVFKCLNCGHNAAFKIHGEYTHEINSFDEESLVPEEQRDALLFYVYKWRLLECLVCSKPTLVEIGDLKNYSDQTEYYEDYEASVIAASYLSMDDEIVDDSTGTWILYPSDKYGNTQAPSPNMPKAVANIFNEARSLYSISPRASAALLRLALQKLCKYLGLPGEKINDDIRTLVKQGLSIETQQALDIIRVIGNNAVHPGEIDLNEKGKTVLALFSFLNYIVEDRKIRLLLKRRFNALPEKDKKNIEKRDGK